mmetsp:Transcript_28031/g.65859  ORF Transcript_28031/g.65859 Transcript_28031/m.65859 type:complete len:418 (+) Transcript_28031:290-1543(+)|eukprot:CAMPEP_0197188748 /NCGR_PEP_ID=MMETSP1423-20130617/18421_1 /TAXON_ID=476441 /ORGANISM="Pseudo-nitzschia heimii, Strain UNC1101" /LENGTH=417 /DNA_ID=CAMNT_0042640677 /DNA_START=264 /DNA_END=1517 /DNA_ORIENTATION=-
MTRLRESVIGMMVQRKHIDSREDRLKNHLHAQKLNNIAASCIDVGQYGKAVAVLVKALCLSPIDENNDSSRAFNEGDICSCPRCSLDECIAYSEDRAAALAAREQRYRGTNCYGCADNNCKTKKRRIDVAATDENTSYGSHERYESTIGYTHRRPIYVPPAVCNEGHIMGSMLSLIITFNLALASHLQVISNSLSHPDCELTEERRVKLLKVLRLYELAYRWQEDFYQQEDKRNDLNSSSSSLGEKSYYGSGNESTTTTNGTASPINGDSNKYSSLRFDMIICNNLSEIHRMLQNDSKQEKCLEHLLSLLMVVVDWQRDRTFEDPHDDEEFNNNALEQQQQRHENESQEEFQDRNCASLNSSHSSLGLFDLAEIEDRQEEEPERSGKRERSTAYMQLDGFWKNITPFLLQNNCAEAA